MAEYSLYPEKPVLVKQQEPSNWALTVFTIVLFIAVFLSFYRDRADFVFSLVLVLLIHEFGHYFFMKLFRYQNVRMLFIPMMGAFVQGTKETYSQRQSVLVALSGPIPGILIGAICLVASTLWHIHWLVLLSFIFLFINAVNLLPLDPLDGGQVLNVLFLKQHDWYGLLFALSSSLILLMIGFFLADWLVVGFGFILGLRVRAMQVNYRIRKALTEREVDYRVPYEMLSNRDYHVMKEMLVEYRPMARQYAENINDQNEQLLAQLVNELLLPPMQEDIRVSGKWLVVGVWVICLAIPVWLLLNLDLYWYFASL